MARSSFGGGGDYSSLFGSLYAQSKSLKDQQQSALDQDAYDRWKNGLSTDDEWIQYIQGRVDATANDKDPSDHQHWIQLQRQYVTSIADSQAEYAYSEGNASISELIAYYQGRLGRLQEDSDEYRQLKAHVNDLVDKRDSDDLSTGAQDISAKIDRGQATYQDLLKFYQSHLASLRLGSDLYKQVSSEITKVKGTIADTKTAGEFEKLQYLYESNKLSGGAYAKKLTQMAQQYKESDPQKFYQILEAANRVRKAGGPGGGGGGGGGGSLGPEQKNHEDQLLKIDSYLDQFTDAYKAGARVIPDPAHPGQQIVLTPELIGEIDKQRLANYDKLAALYKHAGDGSKYGSILNKKTKYIVDYVQPHNTIDASQQWGQLVGALQKTIDSGKDSIDSEAELKKIVGGLQGMQKWLQGEVTKNGKVVNAADQPTGDFVENGANFVSQALAILTDPEMDSQARQDALEALGRSLDTDSGANYDKGTKAAMQGLLASAGARANDAFDIATGKKLLAITDNGIEPVDAKIIHTLGTDPATGQSISKDLPAPDIQLKRGQRVQEVWIDRGGTPTKIYAVVNPAPSGYSVWVAQKAVTIAGKTFKKGAVIPSDVVDKGGFQASVDSGAVAKKDAFAATGHPLNYIQVPAYDDNGQHYAAVTWYQDPQTKLWHQGRPPVSSSGLNADGTVKVGRDGKLDINWMPFSNVAGEVAPYVGSDDRAMQDNMDKGLVGTDPRYNQPTGYRDNLGNYTADPTKSVSSPMYFDPMDESSRAGTRVRPESGNIISTHTRDLDKIESAQITAATRLNAGRMDDPAAALDKFVTRMAQSLGISIGESAQRFQNAIPGPTPAVLDARQSSLKSKSTTPKIDLPEVAKTLVSSGPALANLPAVSAGKIDPAKITPVKIKANTRPGERNDDPNSPLNINAPTTVIAKHGGAQEYN